MTHMVGHQQSFDEFDNFDSHLFIIALTYCDDPTQVWGIKSHDLQESDSLLYLRLLMVQWCFGKMAKG